MRYGREKFIATGQTETFTFNDGRNSEETSDNLGIFCNFAKNIVRTEYNLIQAIL